MSLFSVRAHNAVAVIGDDTLVSAAVEIVALDGSAELSEIVKLTEQ